MWFLSNVAYCGEVPVPFFNGLLGRRRTVVRSVRLHFQRIAGVRIRPGENDKNSRRNLRSGR